MTRFSNASFVFESKKSKNMKTDIKTMRSQPNNEASVRSKTV